jgi:2-phosphosulfolactate phosphatase
MGTPPMDIDVILNPAEIALLPHRDLSDAACVVFDVLRATSSMTTALAHGAAEIHPVRTIEEARDLKLRFPDALLGGERQGDPIPGFDLGNSPFEYQETCAGRRIISTTTNGTIALRACEMAGRVLVGAILNLNAVAEELRRSGAEKVALICAGTFADFALEDAWAAGALILKLKAETLSDSAQAMAALAGHRSDPASVLRGAKNGRALISRGREKEVDWCARESALNVVGEMKSGVIRGLEP